MMSDGLPEHFNETREMFDFGRVKEVFLASAGRSPQQVIDALVQASEQWSPDRPPHDDMTFVVIRSVAGLSAQS
jgi:serine phosphatase RsbU (regulator of sigma subunit)